MVKITKLNTLHTKTQKWSSLLLLLVLASTFVLTSSFDNPPGVKKTTIKLTDLNKKIRVGGDFSLDFVASAPYTYNHATGGGAFDDRTIGKNLDVVESLEGGDFTCGDKVSFLTQIVVDDDASGNQTIELDYSFLAAATGQPGVALWPVTYFGVNYGVVSGGDGPGGTDAGMIDNGNSVATMLNDPDNNGTLNGTLFIKPATTTATLQITGLEAGEHVIVRIDVQIACQIPSSPTGNLQADISAGRVQGFTGRNAVISVGQQTVPFKNVNLIGQGNCNLNDYTDACAGDIKTYTATTTNTTTSVFAWTLTGDAEFVSDAAGTSVIANPGNVATAYVRAKAPSGTTGCYKVTVSVTSGDFTPATCCDLVTVYAIPPAPTVTIDDASLCGSATATVTVTCPLNPSSGDPIYEYQNGSGAWQTSPVFSGLAAGSQFSIKVRRIGTSCTSAATDCTNYTTRTCSTPTITSCTLDPCPTAAAIAGAQKLISVEEDAPAKVLAAPNPYSSSVNFKFVAPTSGNATLELYDLVGRRIAIVYKGQVDGGRQKSVDYRVPSFQKVPMIYKLTINGKTSTGKLLPNGKD